MNTAKDFGAPLLLLLIGVLGKWIVRRNWNMALLFMGPDLVLAGLGSDLAHLLDFGSVFLPGNAPLEQVNFDMLVWGSCSQGFIFWARLVFISSFS